MKKLTFSGWIIYIYIYMDIILHYIDIVMIEVVALLYTHSTSCNITVYEYNREIIDKIIASSYT